MGTPRVSSRHHLVPREFLRAAVRAVNLPALSCLRMEIHVLIEIEVGVEKVGVGSDVLGGDRAKMTSAVRLPMFRQSQVLGISLVHSGIGPVV